MAKDIGEDYSEIYGKPEYPDWYSYSSYEQYDRVNYKGATYAARKANSDVNPFFDDGETWQLIEGVAFDTDDTLEVENVNGIMVSGRKVNASGGVGSNVTSAGLNIYGIKASKTGYGVVKAGDGINIDDGVISASAMDVWNDVSDFYNVIDSYSNYCTTKIYESTLYFLIVVSLRGNYSMSSGIVISSFDELPNIISKTCVSIGNANNYDSPSFSPNASIRFSSGKMRITAQSSFPTVENSSLYFIIPKI